MSLDYASDHLTAAVRSLATSEDQLVARPQSARDDHVQMAWMNSLTERVVVAATTPGAEQLATLADLG